MYARAYVILPQLGSFFFNYLNIFTQAYFPGWFAAPILNPPLLLDKIVKKEFSHVQKHMRNCLLKMYSLCQILTDESIGNVSISILNKIFGKFIRSPFDKTFSNKIIGWKDSRSCEKFRCYCASFIAGGNSHRILVVYRVRSRTRRKRLFVEIQSSSAHQFVQW